MEAIKQTFAKAKQAKRAALVAYVTAGFPTAEETVDIMLGMENGGAGMQLNPSSQTSLHFAPLLPSVNTKNCSRHHRAWNPLHRPNRRWPDNPEGQYEGLAERCHSHNDSGNGPHCPQEGSQGPRALHGLLQPAAAVRR